ncbi:cytidylyltransferase domain-containing protein [Thiomicrorhabdus sediminis]|uniref:Acylneuraminate cytidylyltransferase family protein n=1 Tax=Thiomicrorhabdus sediminis TaxID=2580412 RepID=A0A4P9K6G2_9GAMM|nr:acylneuraminate cytidylyltransferase family protein [Thiomicrorhabdus sediminis]QCU90468.1 acylneuraminate cytidylyltransferase family protein [Thiomicrorhabdus sediminis]
MQAKKVLGLIPARGGSKGIPKKNLYPIMGKPLLQYSFEAVKKSRFITDVMMSTEDSDIMNFANIWGVDTRYKRPDELATDSATTIDVVLHALDWLEEIGELPDLLILLQPTSPLRTEYEIDGAIEQFLESGCDSLVSVHKMLEHPYKCMQVKDDGWEFLAKPASYVSRRQDYKNDYFAINGALYVVTPSFLREKRNFVVEGLTELYEISSIKGTDVDELADIFQVEAYLKMASQQ